MISDFGTYRRPMPGAARPSETMPAYGFDGEKLDGFERPDAPHEHSILRSGNLARHRVAIKIWELILVPWLFLVLVLFCYLQAGARSQTAVLWLIPLVLLPLSMGFVKFHYTAGNNPEVVLGILVLTAISIALIPGVYINSALLPEYRRLTLGASYFNVLPTEAAAGKLDAGTMVFAEPTTVDTARTFGYTDATTDPPTTYCVAPISDGGLSSTRVEYWVAGTNCCRARSDFTCGAASSDPHARGAIVLPQDLQASDGFRQAISGATSAYQLELNNFYLLTDWRAGPNEYVNSLWDNSVHLVFFFGGVYLLISMMVGCALVPVLFGGK